MTTADIILCGNNLTSFIVVMLCWWLAHAHAGSAHFLRRVLAVGYGVVGLTTFGIALFRNLVDDMPGLAIVGKVALIFLFCVLAYRQHMKVRRLAV
jgi:hypothetical protein